MPFQLYPQLACGASNEGVVKDDIFREMIEKRAPDMTDEQRRALDEAEVTEQLLLLLHSTHQADDACARRQEPPEPWKLAQQE